MAEFKITKCNFQDLNVELNEPFGISGGAQATANNLLFSITLDNSNTGYGEAAPLPAYNGETQALSRSALQQICSALEGLSFSQPKELIKTIRDNSKGYASAICAAEVALLDAYCKSIGIPFWKFFGDKRSLIETDMTVTLPPGMSLEESIEHAKKSAESIKDSGIRIIKTKVGKEIEKDLKRILAIHEVSPESPLILDGNCALSSELALELLVNLKTNGIIPYLFEQPVASDDLEGLKRIEQESGVTVVADESVKDLSSAQKIIDGKVCSAINIKIMKSGIFESFEIAKTCFDAGIKMMIGGNVETILAMNASAMLSYGSGLFSVHDLDTPAWMITNPFKGGFTQNGGIISIQQDCLGHGVYPK